MFSARVIPIKPKGDSDSFGNLMNHPRGMVLLQTIDWSRFFNITKVDQGAKVGLVAVAMQTAVSRRLTPGIIAVQGAK